MSRLDWDKANRRDRTRVSVSSSVKPAALRPASDRQVSYIRFLERELGISPRPAEGLSSFDASDYIRLLKRRLRMRQ